MAAQTAPFGRGRPSTVVDRHSRECGQVVRTDPSNLFGCTVGHPLDPSVRSDLPIWDGVTDGCAVARATHRRIEGSSTMIPPGGAEPVRTRAKALGERGRCDAARGLLHAARPELHAQPWTDGPGCLRHGVLPGALAAPSHDEEVASTQFETE